MKLKEFIFAILDQWEQSLSDPAFVKNPITVANRFIRETKALFEQLDTTKNDLSNEIEIHFQQWQEKVVSARNEKFEWDNRYNDNLLAAWLYRELLKRLESYPGYSHLASQLLNKFDEIYKLSLKDREFAQFKRSIDQQITAACANLLTYPTIVASDNSVQFTIACDENTTPPHISATTFSADGSRTTTKLPLPAILPSELSIGSTKLIAVLAIKPSWIEPTLIITVDGVQKPNVVIQALLSPPWKTDINQIGPMALAYSNAQQKLFIVSNRAGQLAYVSASFNPTTGTISSISAPVFPFNLPNTAQSSPSMIINPHTGTPIIAAQISDNTTGRVRAVVATQNGIIELGAITNNNNGPILNLATDNTFIVTLNSAAGIYQQTFALNGTVINSPELIVGGNYGNASYAAISSGPFAGYSATAFDDGSNAYALIVDTLKQRKLITLGAGTHAKVDTKTHGALGFTWKQNNDAMFTTYTLALSAPASSSPQPIQQPIAAPLPINTPNAIAPIAAPVAQPPIPSLPPSTYTPTFFQPATTAPSANIISPPNTLSTQHLLWILLLPSSLLVIALVGLAYIYNKKRQNHIQSLGDKFLNNLHPEQLKNRVLAITDKPLLDSEQNDSVKKKRSHLAQFDFLPNQFDEAMKIIAGWQLNNFDDQEVRQLIKLIAKETQPNLRFWVWVLDEKHQSSIRWQEKLKQVVSDFLQKKKEQAHEGTELLVPSDRTPNSPGFI